MNDPKPKTVTDWTAPHWDEQGYLLFWDKQTERWRRAVPTPTPPQAASVATESQDLAAWLLEQIAEDERRARLASPGPWSVNDRTFPESIRDAEGDDVVSGGRWGGEARIFDEDADAFHMEAWHPARVRAECDAKRRIVGLHVAEDVDGRLTDGEEMTLSCCVACRDSNGMREEEPCPTLCLLALPYADRPGYLEEWRP